MHHDRRLERKGQARIGKYGHADAGILDNCLPFMLDKWESQICWSSYRAATSVSNVIVTSLICEAIICKI
jgi:hypothetical protein